MSDLSPITTADETASMEQGTPGLSHLVLLGWIERTGLPAWQLGITIFLLLAVAGVATLVIAGFPNPEMYYNVVAFVAIISFFLVFYIEMGRGWHQDLKRILAFDAALIRHTQAIQPSRRAANIEIALALLAALINVEINALISLDFSFFSITAYLFYCLEWLLVLFSIDVLARQWIMLNKIARSIEINLLHTEVYSVLANSMLRFLKLYIFGMCVITMSFIVFTSGELGFDSLLIIMMPFYLPGLILMSLFLIPCHKFKARMQMAKSTELNHVLRAINGDRAHLASSLVGSDADKLSKVDLMYYEDRIRNIKEWPFTDRIRSMLLFGVLPPLTWVIAALIEVFIEGVVS